MAKPGIPPVTDIGAGVDFAARRNPTSVEFEHVLVSGFEFRTIGGRQLAEPGHAVIARGKVLDLPLPRRWLSAILRG